MWACLTDHEMARTVDVAFVHSISTRLREHSFFSLAYLNEIVGKFRVQNSLAQILISRPCCVCLSDHFFSEL